MKQNKIGEVMSTLRKGSKKTLAHLVLGASLVAIPSCSSFTTVAMQRHLSRYSNEQAALVNNLTTDFLNKPGYHIGHKFFYEDSNYRETGKAALNQKD